MLSTVCFCLLVPTGSFGQADSPSNREGEVSSPKKPENFENIFPFDSAGEPATVPAISIGAQATQLEDSSRHRAGDAVRGTKGSAAVNKDASGETGRVCQDDAQSVDSKPCAAGAWSDSVSRQASKPIDVPAKQSPGSARAHGMTKSVAASAVRRVSVGTSQQLSLAVTADKPPPQLTPLLPLLTGSQASPARVLSSGFLPENPPLSGRSISVVPPTCIDGGSAGAHAGYDPYMDLVKEMMVDKQGAEHGTSSGSGLAPSAPFAGPMGAYSSSTLPLLGDIFSDVKGAGGHCRPVRHMKPVAYPKVASWDPSIPRSPVISVSRALGDLRRRSNPESMTTGASMGAMAAASASASACELGAGAAMSGTGAVGSSATVGIHASYGAMGMASSGRTLFAGSAPSAHNLGGSLSGCPSLPAMSCPSLGIAHSELSRGASFSDSATVMPVPSAHEWNATKGGGHYRAKGHGASIHGARSVMSSPPCDDGYLGRGAGAATSAPSTPSLLDLKRKFSRAVGYDLWSMQQQPQQPPLPTPQQQPQVHPAGRRRSYDSDEYGEVDSRSAVSRSSMSYMETIIQEGLSEGLSCPGMPGKRVCPSEGDPSCSMDVSSGIAGAHASWDARMQGHLMGACDPLAGDSADPLADFELAFDSPDMDLLREEPHHVPYGGGLDKGLNTLGKASGGLLDMLGRRHRHNEDVTHVVSRFC
eukprot:jgi/Mesvir1/23917/Mv10695-RA.2